jgi:hypothetical protein
MNVQIYPQRKPCLIRIQMKPSYASLSFKPKGVTSHGLQFKIHISNHLTKGRTNGGRQAYIAQRPLIKIKLYVIHL